jgi:hypothetical protein
MSDTNNFQTIFHQEFTSLLGSGMPKSEAASKALLLAGEKLKLMKEV